MKTSPPTKKRRKGFTISLTMGSHSYFGRGKTPAEALGNLPRPEKIMSKGVVLVTGDTGSHEMLMQPVRIKRLFLTSQSLREILANNLFSAIKN